MIPETRRRDLLTILEKNQYMTIDQLANFLHISIPTVRRDLLQLEQEGLIKRNRGGASFISRQTLQWPFTFRHRSNIAAKTYIAELATAYIKNGDHIFLDSSSSCYCLAEQLKEFHELRVMTNGIPTLQLLGNMNGVTVDCVCGTYHPKRASIYGYEACDYIARHHAKLCFLSCQSLNIQNGAMDGSEEDIAIKKSFSEHADQTIYLIDHSKFNKNSYFQALPLNKVDTIVTDQPLPEEWEEYCKQYEIEVVY